jgi:ribosomal protein L5
MDFRKRVSLIVKDVIESEGLSPELFDTDGDVPMGIIQRMIDQAIDKSITLLSSTNLIRIQHTLRSLEQSEADREESSSRGCL